MGALAPETWFGCLSAQDPVIEIRINKHTDLNVYTSGSRISGSAVISPQSDLPFEKFEISFVGAASTRVDSLQRWPPTTASKFVQLNAIIKPTNLPETRVLKAGQTYSIPFNFVVPCQLPSNGCRHHCGEAVKEQHLRLPPSLGCWDRDDQAPCTAKIEYAIQAVIDPRGTKKSIETRKLIRVLPLVPEDAPILLNPDVQRYRLSCTKKLRPSLISFSIGSLNVTASQPTPVILAVDSLETSLSSVRLNLEFAPTSTQIVPPDLHSVTASINSETYFSATPIPHFPDLEVSVERQLCSVMSYSTNTKIDIEHPEPIEWRQDACSSRGSDRDFSDQSTKHVATLAIPFSIPNRKNILLLPTFHSCFISRTYTIYLNLTMGPSGTTFALAIPLQVTTIRGTDTSADELPQYAQVYPEKDNAAPPYDNDD